MSIQAEPALEPQNRLDGLLDGTAAALFDALMTYVPVGITIAQGPDVEILRVSNTGSELLGRPREVLETIPADLHVDAYKIIDPATGEPADAARLPLTRATLDGEVVHGEEWIVTTEDGRPIPILCNAGPIRDDQGAILGGIIAWTDLTRQKQLEMELRAAVAMRDTLMAELHHRVKNHLQIVGSILRAESRGCGEEASALAMRLDQRLGALADSYTALQQNDNVSVPAGDFLQHVCRPLITPCVHLEIDTSAGIQVSGQAAPILGIIVNEAVCNALKHAFPDDRPGQLKVSLSGDEGSYRLEVADDGQGLNGSSPQGSGSGLIRRLAKQLGGSVDLRTNDGPGSTLTVTLKHL